MLDKSATTMDGSLLARFAAIVGEKYAITDPQMQPPYLRRDARPVSRPSPMVLRPATTAQVAAILKLANETLTPIVPQGGNTGLVGGQTPLNNEIVLSLTRLDRIREVDPTSNTITCEAGVTLQRAREAAAGSIVFIRNSCPRKAPAPSAATSPPMPAARPPWLMASRGRMCSASK